MKKMLMISTMAALVLAACGEENVDKTASSSWNGTWEKIDGEKSVCRDSFTFKGENNFEIQNSRVQGGEHSSGTYKHIENNDYEFDYGGGSDNFIITVEGDTMKAQLSSSDNVCEYKKVD
ncbi:hypothetical protein ACFWMS_25270 [Peribacillus butanolivorans]|uniref:hypothetical protein n=1 Tax=Peribacillus butanolivorans TaxID=421767 RepID=UPI00364C0CC9